VVKLATGWVADRVAGGLIGGAALAAAGEIIRRALAPPPVSLEATGSLTVTGTAALTEGVTLTETLTGTALLSADAGVIRGGSPGG
jgi:hypothetical protein